LLTQRRYERTEENDEMQNERRAFVGEPKVDCDELDGSGGVGRADGLGRHGNRDEGIEKQSEDERTEDVEADMIGAAVGGAIDLGLIADRQNEPRRMGEC
jgi:hypothetical protein